MQLTQLYAAHIQSLQAAYAKILAEHGLDRLVIYAGQPKRQFLDDMYYPFKANPHFKVWVPILDNPHCWLIFEPGNKPTVIYYQPVDYWHKVAADPTGDWVTHCHVMLIKTPEAAASLLKINGKKTAFIGEWEASFADYGFNEINPQALLHALHWLRAYKTPYEQACMRLANGRAVKGHQVAEAGFFAGKSTLEIHCDYLCAIGQMEHELPYENIIAVNENAAVLHYHGCFTTTPKPLHSFLIDAGASFHGYAADITRTYAYESGEFQELIQAMDIAQQAIVQSVRIGMSYADINLVAHLKIAAILQQFDFVRLAPEACVEQNISGTFFAHGIGHLLGLQVHDVGGHQKNPQGEPALAPKQFPFLRLTRTIEANQVFTIEPGLYFIPSLLAQLRASANAAHINWDKIEKFMKYGGIRIEDNILVHADRLENLTRDAFGGKEQ